MASDTTDTPDTPETPGSSASPVDGFEFSLEEAGPARKRLHITITSDHIRDRLATSLGTVLEQATMPGFRKGRVPKHLIEKRFGQAMREDARNELIQEGYQKGLDHFEIQPLGDVEPADPDAELELTDDQPLSFAVEFEVVPEFEFPDLAKIEIKRPQLDVTDDMIDAELERQCMRHGSSEELEKGFTAGDRMLGAAELTMDGEDEALYTSEQVLVVLPEKGEAGQVLGLMCDDLCASFAKSKLGDTVTIKTTGPESHEREDIRGKELSLAFTIHLCERITPCTPEELIERFSLTSNDVLREQIKLALEQQRDEEQANAMREQAIELVSEAIDMELPEKASERQVASDLERIRMELMQQGLEPELVEGKLAEVRERSASASQARLKSWFMIQRVANDEDIQISEQEINGRIASMAMQRGARPDQLRTELVRNNQLMALASSIRDRKAADVLVGRLKAVDCSMDEWNTILESRKKD